MERKREPGRGAILAGLRIIDLSWGLAGSVAAQILAEAGADVAKVEPPGGDPLRELSPAAFATWNRSKRSVVLDLRNEEERARLSDLLATADVLIHGLIPSKAKALGLDDVSLTSRFPRLVVAGITGYPPRHADAERPGWDLLVQARNGLMDTQVGWRPGPFAWRFPGPSWGAAFLAATGIVARLIHREQSGRGGPAHTSLAQGLHLLLNMCWNRAERPSASLLQGTPGTLDLPQIAMYECADRRWLAIMNPAERVDLSQLPLMVSTRRDLGLVDVPFDRDVMARAMREHPSEAWLEEIRAADVAVESIADLGDLLRHEEVLANEFAVEVDDRVWGATRQAAAPFRTEPPSRVRSPAPGLGQHTIEVGAEWCSALRAPATVFESGSPPPRYPLEGVKVVDFGAFLAGPMGPMLLADLGAEVIKVEPRNGDPLRGWRDGFYVASNRGKRGIAVDLRHPDSAEIRKRLIAWADVVHHNIRMEAATRLSLDEVSVRTVNEGAIFGHGSSYGLQGKRASWPGYDSVFQSMSGWNNALAGKGNPPLFNHLGTLDSLTATSSALATLLALYHRLKTGESGVAWSALLNVATFTSSETLLRLGEDALASWPELDAAQMGLAPGYRIYEAADGWVGVVAFGEARMRAFRAVAGVESDDELDAALGARRVGELLAALARAGVACERVRSSRWLEVWDDPENLRTGLVARYEQADWGLMEQFGAYWDFGDLVLRLDRACPAVGEHTVELLAELGFDAEQIRRFGEAGVVAGPALPAASAAGDRRRAVNEEAT
jgi:crotonobetainyl-CoA:carnitine CoA-transferase CaiB-like acyl-CoA transferase